MTTKDQTGVSDTEADAAAAAAAKEAEEKDGAADQSKVIEGLKAAVKAEREKRQAAERLARLEGEVVGLKTANAPAKEQTYTRAQLRALVNEAKITEDQMDAQLEKQMRAEMAASAASAAAATASVSKMEAELARYIETFPDLNDRDSDTRARVQEEFDYLVNLGDDAKAIATELKAVRAALGPIVPKGRKKRPETHQETGGAETQEGRADEGPFKGIPARLRQHYEQKIQRGLYKGANDPLLAKELKLVRERQGATAH